MSKSRLKTADWLNVKAGKTSTLLLEGGIGGHTYHSVVCQITHEVATVVTAMSDADMATHISRIRLQAGKETLWSLTGDQLLFLNDRYKVPAYVGLLPLMFAQPHLVSPVEEDHLALGTLDIERPVIEIDWDATVVNPTIESWALVYDGPNQPLGRFITYEDTFYQSQAAAGEYHIREGSQPWVDDGLNLKSLHIDTASISKIVYRQDGKNFEETDTDISPFFDDVQAFRTGGRQAVAGWTSLDVAGNRIGDMRSTSNWIKPLLSLTTTAATDFSILYEVVINGLPNRQAA